MTREEFEYAIKSCGCFIYRGQIYYEESELIKAFEDMGLIEQEPKTGHWIEEDMFDGDVAYRCSECNELFWIEDGTPKDNGYNFCPKCGARMVGDDDGR